MQRRSITLAHLSVKKNAYLFFRTDINGYFAAATDISSVSNNLLAIKMVEGKISMLKLL
jgi:hypothetical protein